MDGRGRRARGWHSEDVEGGVSYALAEGGWRELEASQGSCSSLLSGGRRARASGGASRQAPDALRGESPGLGRRDFAGDQEGGCLQEVGVGGESGRVTAEDFESTAL